MTKTRGFCQFLSMDNLFLPITVYLLTIMCHIIEQVPTKQCNPLVSRLRVFSELHNHLPVITTATYRTLYILAGIFYDKTKFKINKKVIPPRNVKKSKHETFKNGGQDFFQN